MIIYPCFAVHFVLLLWILYKIYSLESNLTGSKASSRASDKTESELAFEEKCGSVKSKDESFKQDQLVFDDSDKICIICSDEIQQYAISQCNHTVCMKCSMKMRILSKDYKCPTCTIRLGSVIISEQLEPFSRLTNTALFKEFNYKEAAYYFTSKKLKEIFYEVLAPRCPICIDRPPDKTVKQTKQHMQGKHKLHYCGLCINHDHQFFSEFSYYTKKQLNTHKCEGEGKNTPHKGHPQCQLCKQRFYDTDHLHQHMRKGHFICHICDQLNDVELSSFCFQDYEKMRRHFKENHFVCENDSCKDDKLTNAFATNSDLRAHNVRHNKKSTSKKYPKQERKVTTHQKHHRKINLRNESSQFDDVIFRNPVPEVNNSQMFPRLNRELQTPKLSPPSINNQVKDPFPFCYQPQTQYNYFQTFESTKPSFDCLFNNENRKFYVPENQTIKTKEAALSEVKSMKTVNEISYPTLETDPLYRNGSMFSPASGMSPTTSRSIAPGVIGTGMSKPIPGLFEKRNKWQGA